jgi:hypothetical protein
VFDATRNVGYCISNRPGGKGNEDIYRVQKQTESVVIKVTDALNGTGLDGATIDFSECGEKSYQTTSNGIFNFQLLDNLDCAVIISKEGYLSKTVRINTSGLRQSRTLEIGLTNANQAYNGKIVNGSSGYLLDGVKVIATHQGTQEIVTSLSDPKGSYVIALKPDANYILRYSKAGFRDLSFNFKTLKNDSKSIQQIEMLPVGVSSVPATSPKPTVYEPVNQAGSASLVAGFAVQLAASSSPNVDLKPYQANLNGAGTVYTVQEGGKTKVRLGLFKTRDEASVAQRLARGSGYPGAFIVEDKQEVKIQSTTLTQPKEAETIKPEPPARDYEGYLVRLATVKDVSNFKKERLEDVGVITYYPKGNLTVVLLSGYDSKASAEIGLRKARARGFSEAFLVTMMKGEFRKAD